MARLLQTIGHLLPYHLFAYGTLLGTQIYQVLTHEPTLPWKAIGETRLTRSSPSANPLDLRQHKAMLPIPAHAGISRLAETRVPRLLCFAGWIGGSHCCDVSAV
jgi:hypothetical protein